MGKDPLKGSFHKMEVKGDDTYPAPAFQTPNPIHLRDGKRQQP